MKYLYETHLHTSQGSACGRSLGREYPQRYKDLGYAGIFVTDHFFQGNCAAPRSGKWTDRVDLYMAGYYDALNEGCKIGFDVFFGIEQNYRGDEYLIYGIDRQFLIDNPDIERWSRMKLFENVRAYGGCCVQAHPFRERGYIQKMHFQLSGIDGVEALNMCNQPHEDACGLIYAKHLNLPATCGSDIHSAENVMPEKLAAMAFDCRLTSAKDYAKFIREGRQAEFVYPEARLSGIKPQMPNTPYETEGGDIPLNELIDIN